jgi:hypothetical protein
MQELTAIYLSLQTADEREAFWEEVREKSLSFTDEQKALFVLSWSESIKENLESADEVIEASRQARAMAEQEGWIFPKEK